MFFRETRSVYPVQIIIFHFCCARLSNIARVWMSRSGGRRRCQVGLEYVLLKGLQSNGISPRDHNL